MSLILEALRKLDREKGAAERGFLVVAAAPWPERRRRSWPLWTGIVFVLVAGGTSVALWPRAPVPTRVRPAVAPAPSPAPSPTQVAAAPVPSQPILPVVRPPRPFVHREPDAPPAAPVPQYAGAESSRAPVAAPSPAPANAASPSPGLRLQAISERDGKPIALVNDHLMREGDEFEGVRVLSIRGTEVEVEVQGRRTVLRF